MKAEASDSGRTRLPAMRAGFLSTLATPIRRFPQRLHEGRFWQVQVLVFIATAPHYAIETLGYTNPFETLHGLTITLYILPLLYAALNYGWEGAVLTALWGVTLTSPSIWIWHRSEYHWFTEIGQLAVTLPVGILVAWRVDLETKQRHRAEATSADLRLLNEVGEALSHTLDVERQLPQMVRRLQQDLAVDCVSLCLESEADSEPTLIDAADPSEEAACLGDELRARLASKNESAVTDDRTLVVPLLGETGMLGLLGVRSADGDALNDTQVELITTVAQQVRVAVENARLYRQRQESLQSYARQVTQAQEDERLRIARELHDETAQELVQLSRKLEQLKSSVSSDRVEDIEGLLSMTRGTIQAVRRYSRDLRPSILDDLGLNAAIEMVVEDIGQQLPSGATLQVAGEERRLDGPVELALFRIAQEALRNVVKHADASRATVELDFADDEVTLAVTDDGHGFLPTRNMSDLIQKSKLGVVGMKERADLVGGTLELQPSTEGGTRVVVRVKTASS